VGKFWQLVEEHIGNEEIFALFESAPRTDVPIQNTQIDALIARSHASDRSLNAYREELEVSFRVL
jgi:hypothetical protein